MAREIRNNLETHILWVLTVAAVPGEAVPALRALGHIGVADLAARLQTLTGKVSDERMIDISLALAHQVRVCFNKVRAPEAKK